MTDEEHERDAYRPRRVDRSACFAEMREQLGVIESRMLTREEQLALAVERLRARGEALRRPRSFDVEAPRP